MPRLPSIGVGVAGPTVFVLALLTRRFRVTIPQADGSPLWSFLGDKRVWCRASKRQVSRQDPLFQADAPHVEAEFVDVHDVVNPLGVKVIGEIVHGSRGHANAAFHATDRRICELQIRIEHLVLACAATAHRRTQRKRLVSRSYITVSRAYRDSLC